MLTTESPNKLVISDNNSTRNGGGGREKDITATFLLPKNKMTAKNINSSIYHAVTSDTANVQGVINKSLA